MKLRNQLALTASLILASGAAWGHPGHEAVGDVLHIEYLVAGASAVAVGIFALMRRKRDGQV
ncbi:hypothetical protein [Marinobacter sediminum]|uniref:hypothetical protein n=1 Tax=Marinobacter sediminum TaxID=256323 RepID=UPI0019393D4B|nr:hypothetical protein [Marinobacter sediminum]